MDPLSISWPAAIAVIGSVVALTFGVIKVMSQGKALVTTDTLQKEHEHLSERVRAVETQMATLETDLSGLVTTQINDLKGDINRLDTKIDTMVKEVIGALASLKNKG